MLVTSGKQLALLIKLRNRSYGMTYEQIAQSSPFLGSVSRAEVWKAERDQDTADRLFEKLLGGKPLTHWGSLYRMPVRVLRDAIENRVPASEVMYEQE